MLTQIAEKQGAHREWEDYLIGLSKPQGGFEAFHIDMVRKIWANICFRLGAGFPLPLAQPTGEGGTLQLAWDNGIHYVEAEVHPNGTMDWFYRNRATNEVDGTEDPMPIQPTLPEALLERLSLVLGR
jgi:hypothetical protein